MERKPECRELKISSRILWSGREGKAPCWFHPRACKIGTSPVLFMTLQRIGGSDSYGPLHESVSSDGGETWSAPVPVPGYEHKTLPDGFSEGVCDVVPEYHAPTGTILAIGHNVYNKAGKYAGKAASLLRRYSVWGIRNADGKWITVRRKLEVPGFEECSIYSCGCSQRLFIGEDQLLIPLYFGKPGVRARQVCTALFHYDGRELRFLRKGNVLKLPVKRGLGEPSLIQWKGRFLLTLRAEDGHGYHAESSDGLSWHDFGPWKFDDGTPVVTSTTQQHFLELGGRLFLIYTRDDGKNSHVFRFRAPLYVAEVNDRLELIRTSEQIVLPLRDEGKKTAAMGNFHPTKIDDTHAIVTVGEERRSKYSRGDTLCAYVQLKPQHPAPEIDRQGALLVNPIPMPEWLCIREKRDLNRVIPGDEAKMRYVVQLANENVRQKTGGPFAAAIFDLKSDRVIALGVNVVVPSKQSWAHAEMTAFAHAQNLRKSHSLAGCMLVTSCEPCAMCSGATPWSGVEKMVYGATKEMAEKAGFDEGYKGENWRSEFEKRKIKVVGPLLEEAANEPFEIYGKMQGPVY